MNQLRGNNPQEATMFEQLKQAGAGWITAHKRQTCSHPGCSRWLTVGHLKARSVGVRMNGLWYCGYGCFQDAAEQEFTNILAARTRPASSRPRMSLGLELVSRGILTSDQLRSLAEPMHASGLEPGAFFLENNLVTETQIAAARAAIWGCPVFNPLARKIHCDLHVPPVLASCCHALPMHYVPATRQLLLGFLDSVDYELMFALETMTGCIAKACFIKPSDFHLHETYMLQGGLVGSGLPMQVLFDKPQTPAECGRILCNYGAGLDAESVKITLCKNYLWARLQCGTETSDLLFKTA